MRWIKHQTTRRFFMRKLVAAAVAIALGAVSTTAFADGNIFVNANAGASNYQVSNPLTGFDNTFSKRGTAGALRVGYRWKSVVDYGVEAGYGYLGNSIARAAYGDGSTERLALKTRGWLLGGNLKYNITDQWYISGRAGWFRARNLYQDRFLSANDAAESFSYRRTETGTGEYLGVGAGYNITQAISVGLAYDRYHTPGNVGYSGIAIGMYSVQGEYRF
jgi:hypothetical protein